MLADLYIGAIVHYVTSAADFPLSNQKEYVGRHTAAMVVGFSGDAPDTVDLTLFPNWVYDGFRSYASATPQPVGIASKPAVPCSMHMEPGTWHPPEIPDKEE